MISAGSGLCSSECAEKNSGAGTQWPPKSGSVKKASPQTQQWIENAKWLQAFRGASDPGGGRNYLRLLLEAAAEAGLVAPGDSQVPSVDDSYLAGEAKWRLDTLPDDFKLKEGFGPVDNRRSSS